MPSLYAFGYNDLLQSKSDGEEHSELGHALYSVDGTSHCSDHNSLGNHAADGGIRWWSSKETTFCRTTLAALESDVTLLTPRTSHTNSSPSTGLCQR